MTTHPGEIIQKKAQKLFGSMWKAQLAKALNTSKSTISRMVTSNRNRRDRLNLENSIEISKILGIPLKELGYDGIMVIPPKKKGK